MHLRLRTLSDVRAFSVVLTALVLLGNLALQTLLMPPDLADQIRWSGSVIAITLAAPISFFVGLRLHDIHRLYVDLEQAAKHDPLTGLLTRRAFFERSGGLVGGSGVVIMADIDHFKSFNDQYGHATGDAALRRVSRALKAGCRIEDLVARFGGEEFVILLQETGLGDGVQVAERLRTRLEHKPISHQGLKLPITASFGVALIDRPDALEDALARADIALYKAKNGGRNRVCVAE